MLSTKNTSSHLVSLSLETSDQIWAILQITGLGRVQLSIRQRIKVRLAITPRGHLDDQITLFFPTWLRYKELQKEQWAKLSDSERNKSFYSYPDRAHIPQRHIGRLIEGEVPEPIWWHNFGSIFDVLYPPESDSELFASDDEDDQVPLVTWFESLGQSDPDSFLFPSELALHGCS